MRYLFVTLFGIVTSAAMASAAPTALAHISTRQVSLSQVEQLASEYHEFVYFCQTCGDAAPGFPFVATEAITAVARGGGAVGLVLNGDEVAVQHVYVRTEPGYFRNLAVLLDLPSSDAAPSLRVEKVGTSGELITALLEARPVEPADESLERMVSSAPALAAAPASGQESTRSGIVTQLLILTASSLPISLSLGILWFGLFIRHRRRHKGVLPRAIHLRSGR